MKLLQESGSVRKRFGAKLTLAALLSLLLALASCMEINTSECPAGLEPATEYRLFFGLSDISGQVIPEEEWKDFLDNVITPRFPDGLTILDVYGQSQPPSGGLRRESTKVLLVGVADSEGVDAWSLLDEITDDWRRRHSRVPYHLVQESCAGNP
jgi:hypothetical protein